MEKQVRQGNSLTTRGLRLVYWTRDDPCRPTSCASAPRRFFRARSSSWRCDVLRHRGDPRPGVPRHTDRADRLAALWLPPPAHAPGVRCTCTAVVRQGRAAGSADLPLAADAGDADVLRPGRPERTAAADVLAVFAVSPAGRSGPRARSRRTDRSRRERRFRDWRCRRADPPPSCRLRPWDGASSPRWAWRAATAATSCSPACWIARSPCSRTCSIRPWVFSWS